MITKTIEFFAIIKIGNEITPSEANEIFDTFEEARNHINDLIEDGKNKGKFKYSQYNSNYQGCSIARYLATPKMKNMECTDVWDYENGILIAYSNWNREHPYGRRFW